MAIEDSANADYPGNRAPVAHPVTVAARIALSIAIAALAGPLAGRAAEIRVGELVFFPAPAWQRAEPGEEAAQNSFILRWTGDSRPLTLFIPRHTTELKVDEARFRQQLQQRWRAQYGSQARIFEESIAGRRWLACRRPSLESDAIVFHLATVEWQRAHHLLAVVPEAGESVPAPVAALLARLGQEAPRSLALASEDPAPRLPEMPAGLSLNRATPADAPEIVADATPAQALPASAAPRWKLRRVIHALPQGEALAQIARTDAKRSDPPILLSAHGLRAREHGVHGFIDGWRWRPGENGRETRENLTRHWRVQWQPPADAIVPDTPLVLRVGFDLAGTPPIPLGWAVTARMHAVCGPRAELIATFNALDRKASDAPARLARHAEACGPLPPLDARADHADGRGVSEARIEIPVRQDWLARLPRPGRERVTRIVLSLGFSAPAPDFGAQLWQAPMSHYIYLPAENERHAPE